MRQMTIAFKYRWTKAEIARKVMENDAWTLRALLALHNRQTKEEREKRETFVDNGKGFDGLDASFMSRMAETYRVHGKLSPKQIHAIRYNRKGQPRLAKYAGQLLKMANGKV